MWLVGWISVHKALIDVTTTSSSGWWLQVGRIRGIIIDVRGIGHGIGTIAGHGGHELRGIGTCNIGLGPGGGVPNRIIGPWWLRCVQRWLIDRCHWRTFRGVHVFGSFARSFLLFSRGGVASVLLRLLSLAE